MFLKRTSGGITIYTENLTATENCNVLQLIPPQDLDPEVLKIFCRFKSSLWTDAVMQKRHKSIFRVDSLTEVKRRGTGSNYSSNACVDRLLDLQRFT